MRTESPTTPSTATTGIQYRARNWLPTSRSNKIPYGKGLNHRYDEKESDHHVYYGLSVVPDQLKHAKGFLEEGSKVKAYVFFKGRSILFKEQGEVLLLRFANDLEDYGKVEQLPVLEGKRMIIMLTPKKAGTGSAPAAAAAPKVVKKVITTPKPKSEGDKKTEE